MEGEKEEINLVIFWSKNSRKEVARVAGDMELGRAAGALRDRSELSVAHSFLGWVECCEIRMR